jgi:hypothetical protein
MRHLKQTIAPNERAANVPRATPASPVLPAKAKAAAQEAATASGKRLYITKKTLQAARDARKISEAEYNDWATHDLISRVYHGSARDLVAALVRSDGLTQDDIDELRDLFKLED